MTSYLTGKTGLDETVHIYFVDSPYLVGLILSTYALSVVVLGNYLLFAHKCHKDCVLLIRNYPRTNSPKFIKINNHAELENWNIWYEERPIYSLLHRHEILTIVLYIWIVKANISTFVLIRMNDTNFKRKSQFWYLDTTNLHLTSQFSLHWSWENHISNS